MIKYCRHVRNLNTDNKTDTAQYATHYQVEMECREKQSVVVLALASVPSSIIKHH